MGRKYPANIAEKGANHAAIHTSHTTASKSENAQHDPCQANKGGTGKHGGNRTGTMGQWEEQGHGGTSNRGGNIEQGNRIAMVTNAGEGLSRKERGSESQPPIIINVS